MTNYDLSYMAADAFVPPELHELESEVMSELWSTGRRTVRELMEELNRQTEPPRAYTTYMTVMSRLHSKGLLDREREGKTDVYWPALSEDEYKRRRAAAQVDQLVDDYGDAALVHFARAMDRLDPARLRKLRQIARED